MGKKKLYLLFLALILISVFIYVIARPTPPLSNTACAFCDKQIINRQMCYEDDQVMVLYTHKPILPCHFLIIPKRHVERLEMLSPGEVSHIHQAISKVNKAAEKTFKTSFYFIHQKNGKEVGQSVPHVHFHYIAKHKGDSSSFKFLIKMIIAGLSSPISPKEMQQVVREMKIAMNS